MKAEWRSSWFAEAARSKSEDLWRGVEAQHVVSTMHLVDDLAEQVELERLLESSKPPLPAAATGRHFLVFTPFRYRSPHPSRFRAPTDPGIWYGASDVHTACAEVAYWKWRFIMDSEGLSGRPVVTEHTLFLARAKGPCVDLLAPPWSRAAATWAHPNEYGACQRLAREARSRAISWIRYASARRAGGTCAAVLEPAALTIPEPMRQQTWNCKATKSGAFMRHGFGGEAYEFPASLWG